MAFAEDVGVAASQRSPDEAAAGRSTLAATPNAHWIIAAALFVTGWSLLWVAAFGLIPFLPLAVPLAFMTIGLVLIPFCRRIDRRRGPA